MADEPRSIPIYEDRICALCDAPVQLRTLGKTVALVVRKGSGLDYVPHFCRQAGFATRRNRDRVEPLSPDRAPKPEGGGSCP
jgi:hypothetical protein